MKKNKTINTEYIGAGLYEAFIEGVDYRGVGCNELEAIYNLMQNENIEIYRKIANVEYIGYGLYEAQKEGVEIRAVSHNEISAVKKLYSLLIEEVA